jgi:glycine betaine/proline transport system substrate-binding protein
MMSMFRKLRAAPGSTEEESPMRNRLGVLTALALTVPLLAAGCGTSSEVAFSTGDGTGTRSVKFVQQPWEDMVVETQIASAILKKLGYNPSVQEVSVPLAAQALSTGAADAYLGNWWPSQKPVLGPMLDKGSVTVAGTLLSGTQYAPGMPGDMAQRLGIRSLADLAAHGDLFHHEILGIEPGTPGNQYILDAIAKNAYGLRKWKLVSSSTEAMLAEVNRRIAKKEPVVFLAWRPHWMVVQWKVEFLADPQHIWPGAGQIRVLTRSDLAEQDPNLFRFLSQIRTDADTASAWIFAYGKKKQSAESIADAWIAAHPEEVKSWLSGVKTVAGTDAATAVIGGTP